MPDANRYTEAFGRIIELSLLLHEDLTTSLARLGLTESRSHLLWQLHQRGPTTQRVLAEAMQVSPRNITGLVDALVATGFVTREPHPADRRATLVSCTEHGRKTVEAMERDQQEACQLLFGGMPDEQLDCFVTGLDLVLAVLREHAIRAEEET